MTPCRCFNPRTRVGCDVLLAAFALCGVGFNPRTRVGCDDIAAWVLHSKSMFQSTHPRGVRHDKAVAAEAAIAFQSTHPRGVRPARWYCMACQDRVSIHAPAWGATRRPRGHHELLYVSIHAPAWGATPCARPCYRRCRCFNPRTRVGCDDIHGSMDLDERVSIHAPAWGATRPCGGRFSGRRKFQSTHPRGVRPSPRWSRVFTSSCFNPRTRVGCDARPAARCCRSCRVSIHAPAWGATVSMFYPVDSRD